MIAWIVTYIPDECDVWAVFSTMAKASIWIEKDVRDFNLECDDPEDYIGKDEFKIWKMEIDKEVEE